MQDVELLEQHSFYHGCYEVPFIQSACLYAEQSSQQYQHFTNPALFCLPLAGFNFLLMFGLLGHNKLCAGCTVRYHTTIMFIQIQSSHIVETHKTAQILPQPTQGIPSLQLSLHTLNTPIRHTITSQISLIWSYRGFAVLNCVHDYIPCLDYCSIQR